MYFCTNRLYDLGILRGREKRLRFCDAERARRTPILNTSVVRCRSTITVDQYFRYGFLDRIGMFFAQSIAEVKVKFTLVTRLTAQ